MQSTKKIIVTLLFICHLFSNTWAGDKQFDYTTFAKIPVLQEGRVKPLATYARSKFFDITGKTSPVNQSPEQWLADVFFYPEKAYNQPIFHINNPEIINALKLPKQQKKRYSFNQLAQTLLTNQEHLKIARSQDQQQSTIATGLQDLYTKSLDFLELSRAFSLQREKFKINNIKLAEALGAELNDELTFSQIYPHQRKLAQLVEQHVKGKDINELSSFAKSLVKIAGFLKTFARDQFITTPKIIPPQWSHDGENWYSPWEILNNGSGSPQSEEYLSLWQNLGNHYRKGEVVNFNLILQKVSQLSHQQSSQIINDDKLTAEYWYNKLTPFKLSIILYSTAMVICIISIISPVYKIVKYAMFISIYLALFIHSLGIGLRVFIMERPPVATLYESIIFVGLIGAIIGLIIEIRKKDRIGVLSSSALGCGMLLLSIGYANSGDTMGNLSAVLNTNFWLATHVLTITIGYGLCFFAAFLAHIWLVKKALKTPVKKLLEINQQIKAIALVALAFTAVGTLLGGVWADQSWGRFWGWDPKENGALLIVLWLALLLHAKITQNITNTGFAVGMVITSAVVAIAWFGVNLLSVGLHSYGFTQGAALNLAMFCGAEILFGITCYLIIKRQQKYEA